MERCWNFPCQLSPGHPGVCSSVGENECFSDEERHARIQSLIAVEDEGAYLVRLGNPEILLQKIDEYLTEQTDRAYVAYYHETNRCGIPHRNQQKCQRCAEVLIAWMDAGDAREIIRRPLREFQQAKLKGTRHIDGRIL